jgi:NAD(P)-dependent dehydrogenase (short-subunit alcohol dehydrogenase family)
MTSTLSTGANKGLGYETSRRSLAEGHDVWIAARDPERGTAAAGSFGCPLVRLDVTDEASAAVAADIVTHNGAPTRAVIASTATVVSYTAVRLGQKKKMGWPKVMASTSCAWRLRQ